MVMLKAVWVIRLEAVGFKYKLLNLYQELQLCNCQTWI
jgi:hypothetical protein